MDFLLLFLILFSLLFPNINQLPLPFNQYGYMVAREKIKQSDRSVQALNNLNSKEKTVNLYFELLRSRDFLNTKKYFYPSRPIETEIENITNNSFYQFLTLLPKGGNLHIHEFQVLDRKLLLESIKNSPEYDLLYICDQNNCKNKYYLNYFKVNAPSGWTKVKDSNWTIEEIVKKTTLTKILNNLKTPLYATDTEARWNLTNQYGFFSFYSDIVKHNATRFNYMKLVLDTSLKENVQLLEFRRGFFGNLFYFDKNGSRILINATEELDLLLKFKEDYISKNPKLIDFIFIIYSRRTSSKEQIKNEINNLINLQNLYPDFIRGYDMVGEEDQGHTLLFHIDNLINLFNYSKQSNNSFHLLFHAGETNWPEEYLPSNYGDGVSTFENIYDALVLRTGRIGHGLSLAKRPDMYQYIRENKIAIEVCPASNQILGYFNIYFYLFI
jgi:adenosine deaminase CECR1